MDKTKEEKRTAADYFKVEGFKDGVLHLAIHLRKPTEDTVSGSAETYVIGRAFGKLPFMVAGRNLKINASVMLPLTEEEKSKVILKRQTEKKTSPSPPQAPAQEITL